MNTSVSCARDENCIAKHFSVPYMYYRISVQVSRKLTRSEKFFVTKITVRYTMSYGESACDSRDEKFLRSYQWGKSSVISIGEVTDGFIGTPFQPTVWCMIQTVLLHLARIVQQTTGTPSGEKSIPDTPSGISPIMKKHKKSAVISIRKLLVISIGLRQGIGVSTARKSVFYVSFLLFSFLHSQKCLAVTATALLFRRRFYCQPPIETATISIRKASVISMGIIIGYRYEYHFSYQ